MKLEKLGALIAFLAITACGPKEPPLNQFDAQGLLDRGIAAYQAEEWTDAIRYLDHFVLENPRHPRVQEARFYLADAYFGREEYVTAAGRFTRLAEDFPNGEWADDARFKVCDSYRELAPEATLDQTYTQAAIDHCQSLIVYHPDSERVPAAREIIATMENRLARKEYLTGQFYARREAFDSAILYYEMVLERWPQSNAAPDALRAMIEAYDEIGYDEESAAARERLLREYPQSPAARSLAGGARSQTTTSSSTQPVGSR
ncbi:MAG TPA: outer membrane protein assembly factor BamD [Longimicrobiales bacterium]